MTLFDILNNRYEYDEGENGARTVRRRTAHSVGIFGKGRTTSDEEFKPVSVALASILAYCREAYGPCTRGDVLKALHAAADAQEAAKVRTRRDRG